MTIPDPEPRGGAVEPSIAATAARAGDTAAARLKERIYATITVAAVVVTLAEADTHDPEEAALTVAGTALGVWLATLVADEQAHRAVSKRGANRAEIRTTLYVSAPLLLSAVGPLVLIGVSALGAMDLGTALLISAGVEVATLFLWGWRTGLRMGNGPLSALVSGLLDTAIGVGVVGVKLLAGH
ncbi:hypothetical protein [Streptomyces sp. NBC_01481]|uniref:hypothetical protein n=1 Tax=Streptomyces sp. NBC_01481 TaxID=2975869 RepID=UPI0022558D25|nr:hypothetical protein [Streptomyces sp. NBC_01481]MCX4585887.1 hypothetical protein [Streptomyces sp. NBC_01481]